MNEEQQKALDELMAAAKARRRNWYNASAATDNEREYRGLNAAVSQSTDRFTHAKRRAAECGIDLSLYDFGI